MARFLIDVNLPYYFNLWHGSDFLHVKDIDDTWTDSRIWIFSRQENLTIGDLRAQRTLPPGPGFRRSLGRNRVIIGRKRG